MASTQGIRAGRAFVELFADDSKLVAGLRRASARLKAFGAALSGIGLKMPGLGAAVMGTVLAWGWAADRACCIRAGIANEIGKPREQGLRFFLVD